MDFRATDHDGSEVHAYGRVVRPDPASQVAFISDIDDTILRTGMTEGLRSIQRTILRDAHGRKPIPGMPSLYRGLARGGERTHPESTFFYVSASPWNLYDMLIQFLAIRGFPRGPLLLTDWRPGPVPTTMGAEVALDFSADSNSTVSCLKRKTVPVKVAAMTSSPTATGAEFTAQSHRA